MLRQNFVLMKQFIDDGTENPKRLEESVNTLKKYLKKDGKTQLTELQKERVQKIIDEFDYMW
jgi:Na+/phosphate symporter